MTQEKIDATNAPSQGAVEWLIEQVKKLAFDLDTHLGMGDVRVTQGMIEDWREQAKIIQEHMVRHAYNHGWDDRQFNIKESFLKSADEDYYNKIYNNETTNGS